MKKTVALIGNPNCGKTTIFNFLTGSNSDVGNWSGVTVEKAKKELRGNKGITIIDLPGIYSLSPTANEEAVTRDFLIKQQPDLIINVVDITNMEKNLYLSTQILELGIPTLIVLNMIDAVKKKRKCYRCRSNL